MPAGPVMPEAAQGLAAACRRDVYPHVFGAPDRQVAGVLVGRLPSEGGPPRVTGALAAGDAGACPAGVVLTHTGWTVLHDAPAAAGPAATEVVGWYRSRPGHGADLSRQDVALHRALFAHPSQIALVVDPVRRVQATFGWDGAGLRGLDARPTHASAPAGRPARPAPPRAPRLLAHLAALLAGVLTGLALHLGVLAQDTAATTTTTTTPQENTDGLPATTEPTTGR